MEKEKQNLFRCSHVMTECYCFWVTKTYISPHSIQMASFERHQYVSDVSKTSKWWMRLKWWPTLKKTSYYKTIDILTNTDILYISNQGEGKNNNRIFYKMDNVHKIKRVKFICKQMSEHDILRRYYFNTQNSKKPSHMLLTLLVYSFKIFFTYILFENINNKFNATVK